MKLTEKNVNWSEEYPGVTSAKYPFLKENGDKIIQTYLEKGTCEKAAKVFNVSASNFHKWLVKLPNYSEVRQPTGLHAGKRKSKNPALPQTEKTI